MTPTYAELRAAGLCVTCRVEPSGDKSQCQWCREDRARRRRDRIRAGQCTRCPCPALEGSEFCATCRDEKNATNLASWNRHHPSSRTEIVITEDGR